MVIDCDEVQGLFEKFLILGASISWFIGLLRTFAMFVDTEIIVNRFAEQDHLTD